MGELRTCRAVVGSLSLPKQTGNNQLYLTMTQTLSDNCENDANGQNELAVMMEASDGNISSWGMAQLFDIFCDELAEHYAKISILWRFEFRQEKLHENDEEIVNRIQPAYFQCAAMLWWVKLREAVRASSRPLFPVALTPHFL